jgi:hypothetical protein
MRSKYLLTPAQYWARAELLRRSNPNSRAAELAELAARAQELTAHERRAGLIAQLHQQAIAAADDLRAQRQAIGADIAKTVRRRSAEAGCLSSVPFSWRSAASSCVAGLPPWRCDDVNRASGPYLMTPSPHRVRAMVLRAWNPNSRAAELHDLAANLKDRQARLAADRAMLAAKRVRAPAIGMWTLPYWLLLWLS